MPRGSTLRRRERSLGGLVAVAEPAPLLLGRPAEDAIDMALSDRQGVARLTHPTPSAKVESGPYSILGTRFYVVDARSEAGSIPEPRRRLRQRLHRPAEVDHQPHRQTIIRHRQTAPKQPNTALFASEEFAGG